MTLIPILLHRLTTAILSSAKMAATGASIASDGEHPLRGWTRPEEWSNDDRMYFLMSPYPPGKFPSLEDPKFKFWSRLIHSSSCEMRKLTFSLSDVNERFERNSLRPKCLREVVQLMERQGLVVQLERYEQRLREQTDGLVSWSVGLLARPLSWAWRYMTDASGSVSPIHGRFIIVDRLQELCSTVVGVQHAKVLYKSTDLIISTEELDQLCRGADLDTSDARIVKMEMEKQGLIAVGNNDQGVKIVKFASSTNHRISSPLTDVDYGILMLKRTVKQLKEQVKQSTAAAEMYYAQAKAEVKAKRRAQACQLLRKQKLHKKKSEQQQQMLDNLEQILCRIQQAETDTMVMEAYTGGLKAMKAALQAQPLSKEELEDVMDQLQDTAEEQDQIERIIAEDFAASSEIAELEEELARLTLTKEPVGGEGIHAGTSTAQSVGVSGSGQVTSQEPVVHLPQVPSHLPTRSRSTSDSLQLEAL